jgi:hypothetical protein
LTQRSSSQCLVNNGPMHGLRLEKERLRRAFRWIEGRVMSQSCRRRWTTCKNSDQRTLYLYLTRSYLDEANERRRDRDGPLPGMICIIL